jgi:mycothiol synthase
MTLTPLSLSETPQVAELLNRCHAVDGPPIRSTADELQHELNSSLTVMDRDVRVVRLDTGRIAGIVWTLHLPSATTPQRCDIEGYVDPEHRGRGLGRELMSWGVAHARELLTSTSSRAGHPERAIRVSRASTNSTAARLHHEMGFVDVRWFDDLKRSLDRLPDLVVPSGITIEPWPTEPGHVLSALDVKNRAFADHWGSVPTTPEGWHEMIHGYGARPDLSAVARDAATAEIVAVLVARRYPADDEIHGHREAWIGTLGTLASHRGRGVASALVVNALHAFRGADLTHAMIGVDADNPSGAHRIYRGLGFVDHFRIVTSEIVL